jgi:glycosyltransferase involved in cell wall biosynthesis
MSRAPRRPRILAVGLLEPWPLDHGGRLHLYHVLSQLCSRADVTLAIPGRFRFAERLPHRLRRVEIPLSPSRRFIPDDGAGPPHWAERRAAQHFGFRPELAAWLADVSPLDADVVLLNGAVLGQYARFCPLPVVWNPQDELVLATWRERRTTPLTGWPVLLRRGLLYAAYESAVQRRAASTIYVSPVDASWARRWSPQASIAAVPNGVDLDFFAPPRRSPTPGRVTFVGALDFAPNIDAACWFAIQVWPALHARQADRTLHIVGRNPALCVRRLARLPGVAVRGDVPDVRPELAESEVVVVPMRTGGGLKNKILEACAAERPVVASRVALGGLSARPGLDLLLADGAAEWAVQVERLLADRADANVLAARGRAWVEREHAWSLTGERFYEVLVCAAGAGWLARDDDVARRRPTPAVAAAPAERETVCR